MSTRSKTFDRMAFLNLYNYKLIKIVIATELLDVTELPFSLQPVLSASPTACAPIIMAVVTKDD